MPHDKRLKLAVPVFKRMRYVRDRSCWAPQLLKGSIDLRPPLPTWFSAHARSARTSAPRADSGVLCGADLMDSIRSSAG